MGLLGLLCLSLAPATAQDAPPSGQPASKPLFRDPVFDGAADPVVVWNPHVQRWWMFYTNRRANAPGLSGVAWVHGTRIGIAESADHGATWTYVGTAEIELTNEVAGGSEPTHWAPDVVTASDGTHHMFLTVVPGVFENWQHPRRIVHLTSDDLRNWKFESALRLASDRVIDACVFPLPGGGWRMWYNNERDHKSIYYADSPDLFSWTDKGKAAGVGERPGEGPYVFRWKDSYWMLVDLWRGLGVYRSSDLLEWTPQPDNLLGAPGKGADDGVNGGHPGVVVSGGRTFVFYFTHPGRGGTITPSDPNTTEQRRSSIQVVELAESGGRLTADRDATTFIDLVPPESQSARVTIDLARPGHTVSPLLHGLFFEDINFAADGGLYAELVQNRSFEHTEHLFSWGTVLRHGKGSVTIETERPLKVKNPHFARLAIEQAGDGVGLANHGFGGIVVEAGRNYLVSVHARADAAFTSSGGKLRVVIEDETGRPLGECVLEGVGADWAKHEATVAATGAAQHARLVVLATASGRVDLDMVSLFPEHTWKNRRNGVRADLAQMLADMKPAFLRFPGGCIVEGMNLGNAYQWKDTIGDVAERPQNWNRWQDALRNATAPQYFQTYGLGFFEYLQLCEDVGAEPVPILNCGMACQYQSKELVPLAELDPFVQDALDLIEFANGPATSEWGAKRAAMGHPEPFNLKYLGVGNEQWGEEYFERYPIFQRTIKSRHPEMNIVSTAGPGVEDGHWKLAWDKFRAGMPAEVVDEHYYRPPQWFIENATRYDAQDRSGPKVFAGEFAAHEGRPRRNNLRGAISEAAFMTGLVRNSDVVVMSSYAPLFAKAGAWQWAPDLIWFDNSRVYGTPSYHVQALFGRHRPDRVFPVTVDGPRVSLPPLPRTAVATYGASPIEPYKPESLPALFVAAGRDDRAGELVVFVANPYGEARHATIEVGGATDAARDVLWSAIEIASASPDDENSFEDPHKVAPRAFTIAGRAGGISRTLPAWSLTVLRVKLSP